MWSRAAIVGWVLSVVGLASCGGATGSAADGAPRTDAVTIPDAHGIYPDAGPIGEAPPPPCAETGETTVIVTDSLGAPVPNIDVVYSNPDGTIQTVDRTGADGRALATLTAGTQVTVAFLATTAVAVPARITWADPPPGACLRLRRRPTGGSIGFATFIPPLPPADEPPIGTNSVLGMLHGWSNNCWIYGEPLNAVHVPVDDGCIGEPGFVTGLLVALDFGLDPLGFTAIAEVPFMGDEIFVPLSGWRTDFVPWSVTILNDTTEMLLARGKYTSTHRGRPSPENPSWLETLQPGSATTVTELIAAMDPTSDAVLSTISVGEAPESETFTRRTRRAWPGDPDTVFVSDFPPHVDLITVDDRLAARPIISWAGPPQPATTDVVKVDLSAALEQQWVVIADPARSQIQLPELPGTLEAWPPEVGLTDVYLHHVDIAAVDGHAAALSAELRERELFDPLFGPQIFYDPGAATFTSTYTTQTAHFF